MPCQCPNAGYCERHRVLKSEHWHKLCQHDQKYFDAWEKGTGPGQFADVAPYEPGKALEAIPLAKWTSWARLIATMRVAADIGVGDTFERLASWMGGRKYKAILAKAGIPCGCGARKRKWNTLYPYSMFSQNVASDTKAG